MFSINKRKAIGIIFFILFIFIALFFYEPDDKYIIDSSWNNFNSDEGRFSILFPGEVKTTGTTFFVNNTIETTTLYKFETEPTRNYIFSLLYVDYSENFIQNYGVELFFVTDMNTYSKELNGNIFNVKNITLDNYTGKEFEIINEKTSLYSKFRAYIVKNRYYVISVVSRLSKTSFEIVDKFMDSFELEGI